MMLMIDILMMLMIELGAYSQSYCIVLKHTCQLKQVEVVLHLGHHQSGEREEGLVHEESTMILFTLSVTKM